MDGPTYTKMGPFEEEIVEETEKLALLEKEISKISKKPQDDVLTLNVGGKKTTIKRSTLTQVKGSLLDTIFSSSYWEEKLDRDKEGHIFLDFDPHLFGKIIGYLRARLLVQEGSSVPFPVEDGDDENFQSLIAYLKLNEIFELKTTPPQLTTTTTVKEKTPQKSNNNNNNNNTISKHPQRDSFYSTDTLKIVDGGIRVEKPNTGDGHAWVKGKEAISKGQFTWRMKIEEFTYWMFIGVVNVSENMSQLSYSLPSTFGWGGHANKFFIGGQVCDSVWGHWVKGQEIELTVDCTNSTLKLKIINGGTFSLNLYGGGPWQLHLNMYRYPSKVLLL
eukprot:TRINITY_DN1555_c1_g2_i1.p1 TRINITY_DN1555_c1_g2~~TRINITY_DN1555_c1_g2_i1.p1  ORF type:complete len:332 (+),score=78.00 TRINITY_DN1555_c1_g2_i1:136-1131(+)